jgi:hypothetical protein
VFIRVQTSVPVPAAPKRLASMKADEAAIVVEPEQVA